MRALLSAVRRALVATFRESTSAARCTCSDRTPHSATHRCCLSSTLLEHLCDIHINRVGRRIENALKPYVQLLCEACTAVAIATRIGRTLTAIGSEHRDTNNLSLFLRSSNSRQSSFTARIHSTQLTRWPLHGAFSSVCAGPVPVAPAVGAVLAYLRLPQWWHAVWCDLCVVSSLATCIAS